MDSDGRNVKVEELNTRRIDAVKLRLSGVSIAETAKRIGLSQPTVIGALKAYRQGGWDAVPVAPRGRGVKKRPVGQSSGENIKHLLRAQNHQARAAALVSDPNTELASPSHLQRLEAESIHIMREVVAEATNPVMLYSIGKDSSVMLHLARKAFFPAPPPFPLLHVDTTWKFRDMYAFRDRIAAATGIEMLVHVNPDGLRMGINPFVHGSVIHTDVMKTQALKQALDQHRFDAAFGGARRDEEKSRAKERIFSFRSTQHRWDPKNQRPELWKLYNMRIHKGESIRVFPLSNWTELDVWQYIYLEDIPVVPLYFAKERPVVERDGALIMVDDARMPLGEREIPALKKVRFRTLGCYPLTGAIESAADTLPAIIHEMLFARTSERQGRVIDHDSAASMEKKKQEGYF
jgi:sulfate adenylyltransferase subunit 2